jgi:hypothetical protein
MRMINGGTRSVDSSLRWTNREDDGLWWENVYGADAAAMTTFYTAKSGVRRTIGNVSRRWWRCFNVAATIKNCAS